MDKENVVYIHIKKPEIMLFAEKVDETGGNQGKQNKPELKR
jgi:hypothetical protein